MKSCDKVEIGLFFTLRESLGGLAQGGIYEYSFTLAVLDLQPPKLLQQLGLSPSGSCLVVV